MAVRPLPEFSEAELTDDAIRDRMYLALAAQVIELVKDKTQLRVTRELGKDVLEGVTEIVFNVAIKHGYVRLPGGHGSLSLQRLKRDAKPKRLPTGEMVTMGANRVRLRYEEGAAVREALGMPRKTSYKRQFARESVLSDRAQTILKTGKVRE